MTAHGMTVYFRKVEIIYSKPVIFQLWISKIHLYIVTASCHGTKDGSACEPFCCCIMSGADHIVLMPIAVDCLIKWAEIPAPSYLWNQLRSPSIWKLRGSFFLDKCFENGWSPRRIFCTMVVDWAFIDFIKLYLMFPHQLWIFHLSIEDGWGCMQGTTTGHRWRASPLLLSSFFCGLKSSKVCEEDSVWSLFRWGG